LRRARRPHAALVRRRPGRPAARRRRPCAGRSGRAAGAAPGRACRRRLGAELTAGQRARGSRLPPDTARAPAPRLTPAAADVPEGDTVWLTAHNLHAALAGHELTTTDFRLPPLATADLTGRTVDGVVPRGKH